jgi:hypothetical protein
MGVRWQPRCGVVWRGERRGGDLQNGARNRWPAGGDVGVEVIDWSWDGSCFWGLGEVFGDEWRKKVVGGTHLIGSPTRQPRLSLLPIPR